MNSSCSWNVLLVLECLSSMGYPILGGISRGDALVVLNDSILRVVLPLRNIIYTIMFHDHTKPWFYGLFIFILYPNSTLHITLAPPE